MHGSPDGSHETTDNSFYQRWGIGFIALPVLLVIALIGLAIIPTATTNWIADEVMAEFSGSNYGPQAAPAQVARAAR